jgi:hypothetical protein
MSSSRDGSTTNIAANAVGSSAFGFMPQGCRCAEPFCGAGWTRGTTAGTFGKTEGAHDYHKPSKCNQPRRTDNNCDSLAPIKPQCAEKSEQKIQVHYDRNNPENVKFVPHFSLSFGHVHVALH